MKHYHTHPVGAYPLPSIFLVLLFVFLMGLTELFAQQDTSARYLILPQAKPDSSVDTISADVESRAQGNLSPYQEMDASIQAFKLYDGRQYESALSLYLSILSEHEEPPAALYYNIGCCYYRLNHIGSAILYFERAVRLEPSNADIQHNLRLARAKTIDRIDPDALYSYPLWHKFSSIIGLPLSIIVSVVLAIAFGIGLLLFGISRNRRNRRVGFYIAFITLPFVFISHLLVWYLYDDYHHTDAGVVQVIETPVRSTPDGNGSAIFVIHEGAKVRITDAQVGQWIPISIGGDKRGWIQAHTLERI